MMLEYLFFLSSSAYHGASCFIWIRRFDESAPVRELALSFETWKKGRKPN